MPCAYCSSTSRASAPARKNGASGAARRTSCTAAANNRSSVLCDKSSEMAIEDSPCGLDTARVPGAEQIRVDQQRRRQRGMVPIVFERPETLAKFDIAVLCGPQPMID